LTRRPSPTWPRAKSTPTSTYPGSSTRSKRSPATIRVQRQVWSDPKSTRNDAYSLDWHEAGLDRPYSALYRSYFRIFARCGTPTAVEADVGIMGSSVAHELIYLFGVGEDTILLRDRCSYTANRQVATFRKPIPELSASSFTLSQVYVYPIMSCGGEALESTILSLTGLRYDWC
jgi:hypothetical protein